MGRYVQKVGKKGSLKWIQILINRHPNILNDKIRSQLGLRDDAQFEWLSPLEDDAYAEYRDSAFIDRLGIDLSKFQLSDFWPKDGPQWD